MGLSVTRTLLLIMGMRDNRCRESVTSALVGGGTVSFDGSGARLDWTGSDCVARRGVSVK